MKHLSPALALGWQPGNSIGIMHEPGAKLGLTIRDVIAALACLVIVLCSGGCEEQGALPPEGRNQTYRGVLEVEIGERPRGASSASSGRRSCLLRDPWHSA